MTTNPVWCDTSVNVEVYGGNGRYEVRWPTLSGMSGSPDFTTRTDAFRYAESIARAIRTNRKVAHMTALREDATRTTTIDLVLQDGEGRAWVRTAVDEYRLQGALRAGRLPLQRATLEAMHGPLTVEHSIEIRGEVVA